MKKILSISLICLLILSIAPVSYAMTNVNSNKVLYISSNGDGSYEILGNENIKALNNDSDIIKVDAIDSEVYKDSGNNKTLIKVKENTLLEVQEIKIDPLDRKDLEEKIIKYKINEVLANNLRRYVDKVEKKEIQNPKEIIYYTPSINNNTLAGSTYQGYGGKTYYEELVRYSQTSNPSEVKYGSSRWNNYFNTAIKEGVSAVVGGVADSLTGGSWTIANVFANTLTANTIPANSSYRHMAYLIETKYVKTTSVREWNSSTGRYDYYVGATGETSSRYYGNYVVSPGCPNSKDDFTSTVYTNTPNYLRLDYKAYYHYLSTPYRESISRFKYQDKYFTSI